VTTNRGETTIATATIGTTTTITTTTITTTTTAVIIIIITTTITIKMPSRTTDATQSGPYHPT
jgi:hypothetical protein